MNAKVGLVIFLWSIAILPSTAQNQQFVEAFQEFSTSRLWEFEEIPIDWKMEGTLQADLNEGLNNLLESKFTQAEHSFTTVLKKDSSIWQAYFYRAASRKQLRNFNGAERDLQRSLKLRGDFYEGYAELAKVLHLRYQFSESERAINKAIKLDKSRGAAYYLKGDINLAQGQVKGAINNYKDCLAADSLFHDARIKLALLDLVAKKDLSSALSRLSQVLSYDSLQKSALLFRSILGYEKDKKQSVRDLTNLILVSPNNLMAYYYRGLYSTELENYRQAFADFHKVIKATSTDDNNFVGDQTWLDKKIDLQNAGAYAITRVYGLPEDDGLKIKQAYCHILTEAFDKSIAAINQIAKPNEEPLAVYLKAVAYEHKGEHIKALQFYNMALALDNEIADAHKKRGIYEQELKQWGNSIKDFTEVLRLTPDAYVIYRIRGVSYYYNNQFSEAIADYDAYLKYDSANKEIIGYRGIAYRENKQRLKAYVDFALSGNQHALDFKDLAKLLDSVFVTGDTALTLSCLDKITSTTPHFTEGYVLKFRIHLARNDWAPVENNIVRAIRYSSVAEKSRHSYLLTVQAMHYARKRKEEDAVKSFDEAIKVDKKNAMAYLERGKLLLAMGKTSKAESDFKQASSLGNEQAKHMLAAVSR